MTIQIIRKFLGGLLIACMLISTATVASASYRGRIIAVVNDEVISTLDIEGRMEQAINASGLPDSPNIRKTLFPQLLRMMTEELLLIQEAERMNLAPTEADLKLAVRAIEQQNGLKGGEIVKLLREQGTTRDELEEQLKVQIARQKLIARKIHPTINVTDEEVAEVIEQWENRESEREFSLNEIFLPVSEKKSKNEVHGLARELVREIRGGSDFSKIAKEFSQSVSAKDGGKVGWIPGDQLPGNVVKTLLSTREGQVTDPILTEDGYYIVRLNKKAEGKIRLNHNSEVTVKQIFFPTTINSDQGIVNGMKKKLSKLRREIKNCKDYSRVAKRHDLENAMISFTTVVKDINAELRPIVASQSVGDVSSVIESNLGLHVLSVCERIALPEPRPEEDVVRDRLFNKKLELQVRRYIQNLKRQAYIEIRV